MVVIKLMKVSQMKLCLWKTSVLRKFQRLTKTENKYKMLEPDSNLERIMKIHRGIEKIFYKLYDKNKVSTGQTTVGKFLQRIKTLILDVKFVTL